MLTPLVVLLVTSGCGWFTPSATPEWPVREAFDVPAPPGSVSLDLGPVSTSIPFAPGDQIRLRRETQILELELLDVRTPNGSTTLTVYAPADVAEPWVLEPELVSVEVKRLP